MQELSPRINVSQSHQGYESEAFSDTRSEKIEKLEKNVDGLFRERAIYGGLLGIVIFVSGAALGYYAHLPKQASWSPAKKITIESVSYLLTFIGGLFTGKSIDRFNGLRRSA